MSLENVISNYELIIGLSVVWLLAGLFWIFFPKRKKKMVFDDPREMIEWGSGSKLVSIELTDAEFERTDLNEDIKNSIGRMGKKEEPEKIDVSHQEVGSTRENNDYVDISLLDKQTILD